MGGSVSGTVTRSDGSVVTTFTGTVGSDGTLAFKFKLNNSEPTGSLTITASVAYQGVDGLGATAISVVGSGTSNGNSGGGKGGKSK